MLSAPTRTAPAASIRSIRVASRNDGLRSRLILEPARVARPSTSNRFFTAKGTPASGPTLLPAAIAASTARALARARSALKSVKELRMLSCCLIRASAASVACNADILRLVTALAISAAERPPESALMAKSGCKNTGRLGFVGQRKFIDHPRQPQRHVEVGAYRRPPSVLDRQRQRVGDGVDIIVKRIGGHHAPIRLGSSSCLSIEQSQGPCQTLTAPRICAKGMIRLLNSVGDGGSLAPGELHSKGSICLKNRQMFRSLVPWMKLRLCLNGILTGAIDGAATWGTRRSTLTRSSDCSTSNGSRRSSQK